MRRRLTITLANILHAKELARRLEKTGVTAVSLHPGLVRTPLADEMLTPAFRFLLGTVLRPLGWALGIISPELGAQTTLHCLLAEDMPQHNGAYFCAKSGSQFQRKSGRGGGWPIQAPNPNARDAVMAERLWEASEKMVGIKK